jgi:hypothetical protein
MFRLSRKNAHSLGWLMSILRNQTLQAKVLEENLAQFQRYFPQSWKTIINVFGATVSRETLISQTLHLSKHKNYGRVK